MEKPVRALLWLAGLVVILGVFNGCALFSHPATGHIVVKAVSWPLVKKYAEPGAGLVGHKITVVEFSSRRLVAEKLTDDLGDATFALPAGAYTVLGFGGEPQEVIVRPGQTVRLKLVVH